MRVERSHAPKDMLQAQIDTRRRGDGSMEVGWTTIVAAKPTLSSSEEDDLLSCGGFEYSDLEDARVLGRKMKELVQEHEATLLQFGKFSDTGQDEERRGRSRDCWTRCVPNSWRFDSTNSSKCEITCLRCSGRS